MFNLPAIKKRAQSYEKGVCYCLDCRIDDEPRNEDTLALVKALEEAQGKLALLTDATMQHLGGERLERTCDCPLGDVLDDLPKSAWVKWEQTVKDRARTLKGE